MNISQSPSEVHNEPPSHGGIGVLLGESRQHTWELLGDARELADRLGQQVTLVACHQSTPSTHPPDDVDELFERGADELVIAPCETTAAGQSASPYCSLNSRLRALEAWYRAAQPRLLFIPASGSERSLAARLAARCQAELFSPTLQARVQHQSIQITTVHGDGRRARQFELAADRAAILVMNPDVGQPRKPDKSRRGQIVVLPATTPEANSVLSARRIEADPAEANIEHLPRLVAGGFGLGGREGFELLRSVAGQLQAGVAASRMAVDCGWIERERQVGQTGKTVRPELYIACGISGASHHLEGMSQSQHILAINTDPQAPIFGVAHLGLVSDWRQTLIKFQAMLPPPSMRK